MPRALRVGAMLTRKQRQDRLALFLALVVVLALDLWASGQRISEGGWAIIGPQGIGLFGDER